MWQCRKIYANMLLLSVMMFMLGVAVRPHYGAFFCGETTFAAPAEKVDFCWEGHKGELVYRGQQITMLAAHDLYLVLPEKCRELCRTDVFEKRFFESQSFSGKVKFHFFPGRSPPEQHCNV